MDDRLLFMIVGAIFAVLFVIIILLDQGEKSQKSWLHKTPKEK